MMHTPVSLPARRAALAISFTALSILILRAWLSSEEHGGLIAGLAHMSQFFTILTNALTMLFMAAVGFGIRAADRVLGVVVVAIAGVGVLYHVLLAHLWEPEGLVWLADHGVHTAIPILGVLWWFVYVPSGVLRWRDLPLAGIWPLTYSAYALTRASWSEFYPYPFLDLPQLGWGRLVVNVIGLLLVFVMLAASMLLVERVIAKFVRSR